MSTKESISPSPRGAGPGAPVAAVVAGAGRRGVARGGGCAPRGGAPRVRELTARCRPQPPSLTPDIAVHCRTRDYFTSKQILPKR